jgi:hypothetical protein
MVNKVKGEVALQHDGATYSMRLDFNALAEFEDFLGGDANALEVLQDPKQLNAKKTRAIFWCALRQCHPDMTQELAGQILSGNMDKLGEAMSAAFPDAEPGNVAAG